MGRENEEDAMKRLVKVVGVVGSFVDASTVRGATSNDGSLSISSSSCEQQT
jgi:hypothetical protein